MRARTTRTSHATARTRRRTAVDTVVIAGSLAYACVYHRRRRKDNRGVRAGRDGLPHHRPAASTDRGATSFPRLGHRLRFLTNDRGRALRGLAGRRYPCTPALHTFKFIKAEPGRRALLRHWAALLALDALTSGARRSPNSPITSDGPCPSRASAFPAPASSNCSGTPPSLRIPESLYVLTPLR